MLCCMSYVPRALKLKTDATKEYDGKEAIESWLSDAGVEGLSTIEGLINFNSNHQEQELPERE
jgi:hypothetical protein